MKPTRRHWEPFCVPHLEVPASEFKEGFVGAPLERNKDREVVRYLVPVTGGLQLGDTAPALHRVAQALGDPELAALARRQVHWAAGLNPFNVSWICDFGDDCIDQFYSFSQGRMPGCVAGFGVGNDGMPRCVRPNGAEPVMTSGARLLRAKLATKYGPSRYQRGSGRPSIGPSPPATSTDRTS